MRDGDSAPSDSGTLQEYRAPSVRRLGLLRDLTDQAYDTEDDFKCEEGDFFCF